MLQLLHDCSGAFRPGILTALVGSSGAGKTTLMDVLAGRKTSAPWQLFSGPKCCAPFWAGACSQRCKAEHSMLTQETEAVTLCAILMNKVLQGTHVKAAC